MSFEQYEATDDLGKTGYFPFSWYKNITIGNVIDAIRYEESNIFNEYLDIGISFDNRKRNTLFSEITNDHEIMVTVNYGSNEGIYIQAYTFHHDRKEQHKNVIIGKTLSKDDHTMARAWQSAGNLYRFLNGWWE